MPRSEAAEGPADHLTTYLAAGSAMLIKTAAAKGKPITGLKSKHTAGRELNPVASRHLSRWHPAISFVCQLADWS